MEWEKVFLVMLFQVHSWLCSSGIHTTTAFQNIIPIRMHFYKLYMVGVTTLTLLKVGVLEPDMVPSSQILGIQVEALVCWGGCELCKAWYKTLGHERLYSPRNSEVSEKIT